MYLLIFTLISHYYYGNLLNKEQSAKECDATEV